MFCLPCRTILVKRPGVSLNPKICMVLRVGVKPQSHRLSEILCLVETPGLLSEDHRVLYVSWLSPSKYTILSIRMSQVYDFQPDWLIYQSIRLVCVHGASESNKFKILPCFDVEQWLAIWLARVLFNPEKPFFTLADILTIILFWCVSNQLAYLNFFLSAL